MPIRQNILRKGKAPKQNLLGFDVLQEETGVLGDLSTSKFFKISEFPSVLPTGNSSFLIEGSDLLKPDIELKTELLDAEGNPIFHYAIPNYDKELPARRITIEVYQDDVINGIGSFTVLGELDPRKVTIPSAFQNTYNVRFSAPISINKNIKNTQPIRFYGDPRLTVSELVKGVIQPVYTGNQRTKTITGSVSLNVPTPQLSEYGADDSTTADSTRIDEVGNSQAAYISQNVGEAQSSIIGNTNKKTEPRITYVVEEMEKGVDNELNKITSTMKGAEFTITSASALVDSTIYPDADWTKPTNFTSSILDVINSTTFTTATQYKIKSKKNNQELVVPLDAFVPGTSTISSSITHNVGSVVRTASQVFQRSFANMTVGNLRTFSGDTYKAKIYAKEDGSSGEFEKIYETLVESPNELLDQNSNSGFKSVGIFATQSIVDNFWVSSSNTFTATQNDDTLIDGILLSGSTEPNGNSFTFETSQSYSLEKNEPYLVDFNVAFKPTNKVQSDGTTKKDAKLEVFLTGPITSNSSEEFPLGEVDLGEFDFNKVNTFTKVEKRQVSDFLTHNETNAPSGSLGFRVSSGEFILSDVRLRPFSETNFSPGFFKANVPMPPAIKRGQPYDFVVEFYDANNSLAEAVAVADDVVFAGPRQVLGDGGDGILTGSVFLSNTEDTGIEFHGGSAYIRSVGYNGFQRARDEGGSGFLIFSGSVSKSLNTSESYDGVGIEIISGSKGSDTADRFLQFRTNTGDTPSIFKVQTDDFFLGGEGQFVSGSNGNIEISSSKLHINSNGQITGSEILFSGGTITSDVNILGSVAANSILVPASQSDGSATTIANAKASIDDNGNAIFKSGSIGGFTLTDTEISASGLNLKSSGQITGSNVLFSGGTITSDVTILGSVAANSILVPASQSDGSATTIANAKASIDDNGNAIFKSGSIAGFAFLTNTLTASKFELDTLNSQITLGSGDDVFIAGSGSGIQLGHATFGSAPFRVNMDGELTATSVTITGNITATAGPVSSSLTSLGIKTGSLEVASSSLSLASSSFEVSTSLAALTGSEQQDSLNAVGVVSESLLIASGSFRDSASLSALTGSALTIASESMQKQFVLVDDDTLNLQNAKGGILSSFSDYAKFFGSASNALVTSSDNGTVNYTEINDKGFLVVTGSSTASFFGNVTTIGDKTAQHISIAPDSLSIKTANNVTVLSASAAGIVMSGSVTANEGTIGGFTLGSTSLIAGSGTTRVAIDTAAGIHLGNNTFSSAPFRVTRAGALTATSVAITGEVNASSGTTATSITALGFATASLTSSVDTLQDASSSLSLASGSFEVSASLAASSASAATASIAVNESASAAVTTDVADTRAQLVLDNSTAGDQKVNLVNTTGGIMSSFGKGVKFFGSASNALVTASANGTVNYSEVNDKGFLIVTGSTTASFFGNTTTIGDTTAQHISIEPDSISIKTAANKTVLSASAAGITMSGSINAADGTIGGFTLTENQIRSADGAITLNKDSKALIISDSNFGNTGIQLQHNSGTPRAHIGKSNGERITFDGTNAIISSSAFLMGNNTSFVSGSNGNIKISGSSVDIQTPAFVLGDLNASFVSGSNGNLSLGATTFNLVATSSDAGILMDSARSLIQVTGSNSITDGNSVILDGGDGVIQVSQSGEGVFDSGRTEQFERFIIIEPPSFRRNLPVKENISSSLQQTDPVSTMGNAVVTESLKTKFFELDKYIHKAAGISNTPFYYQDVAGGAALNPNARLNNGGNPTSSVFFGVSRNLTAGDSGLTGSLFGPEFVFNADYFTDSDIETRALYGFVSSSDTGSNIFTIATRMSRSIADHDVNFGDAKFNILGLETDTSGLANARQNEYTFLQAKHSQSIRLQIQHDGDIVSKGNITAFGTSFLSVSDEREKEYIYQISESLNKVSKLRPTKFTWKETQKEDVGFIAQEVEKIIPEVVETTKGFINTDEDMNRKTISYPKLIPYLVDTIQELTKRIEELEKKVK